MKSEKIRIIETTAKLLKSDIKLLEQSCDTYPDSTQISVEEAFIFLPNSLRVLLEDLFADKDSKKKVGSIGQAIIQATGPRVLVSPLQIGLAVQMHYNFGSRFLIDSLHEHGFCSSYSEVQRFEHSAALTRGTDIPNFCVNDTIQYMADNVDHNVNTIDGLNTFHGMGMITTITPARKLKISVPRITVNFEDIEAVGKVNIKYLTFPCTGLNELTYNTLTALDYKNTEIDAIVLLHDISLGLTRPRPSWSGTMQMVHVGPNPGPSSLIFLLLIDLNPSDMHCIYSRLTFICEHAEKYGTIWCFAVAKTHFS